ncbi:MAG: hypothetical protein A3I89_02770 [Candidatus Harrisonbacteria bacterium RIFCSPLOWO2_02_FULL_41_11]|uniref:Uncharacterized protein n=1 Tax=Candidatus Harrisonbacteria bacterium RIFCSPHIGHO2_02_FULL_42_16 TaxID=1798404 RepID=A0A1G1ZKE2_9BACT|nr:MAG: hypothetical protein A3B92_00480 [Candidatus Harrisonbacteria bacterium RIFCSPHIGHO2_02_FULL_42_16]OGY66582.1 MAG: hypothetical protein A3I89_02770 [Candidatus Harrisonbacteria bacterium RIFCSPLOWO2_02_FULL_41_11]
MQNDNEKQKDYSIPISIFLSSLILASAWIYKAGLDSSQNALLFGDSGLAAEATELPIIWGDLGKRMIEAGAIDEKKFESLYEQRGGFSEEEKHLLAGINNGKLEITEENSGFILNLFWALGLSNQNKILEEGPMTTYDGRKVGSPADSASVAASAKEAALVKAGNFASTGGWTLADGDAMKHYSKHQFFVLNREQQVLVERVSKNIYRPCCGNSTYFPDCNHGMAMLGFLELMASQEVGEEEMYKSALALNKLWFPDTYAAIRQYLAIKGVDWNKASPKDLLGYEFSSADGYKKILSELKSFQPQNSGDCGVGAGLPVQKSAGCGV